MENDVSINISYDTETNQLSLGGALTKRVIKDGSYFIGGAYGGSEKETKESSIAGNVNVNVKTGELGAEDDSKSEKDFRKEETGSVGILYGTEKEGDPDKLTIGLNPEVGVGLVGVGAGINFSWEESPEQSEENNVTEEEKKQQ